MKSSKATAVFATSFVTALLVSVSFTDEGPALSVGGEEVCADTTSCHVTCETLMEECVKAVKKQTKVGACFQCCKETEGKGVLPLNMRPTRDELQQYMLDKCVFPGIVTNPSWTRDFPRELHAAEAFNPKKGRIEMAVRNAYKSPHSDPSKAAEPQSADESACIKGCAYRTKPGMEYCHQAQQLCLVKCPPPAGGAKCGK